MTPKQHILAALADEAQHVAKTTTIDLDAFLALAPEARAARWRQFDGGAKHQLVALAIVRQTGRDWETSEVAAGIAHYDARYGSEPMDSERAVCAALERLAEEQARTARLARERGDADDTRFFQRATTAYTNALIEYRKGVRPAQLASGAFLLPSRRAGEPPHIVRMDGDWICDCKAGGQMHWPIAMVIGLEVAHDILDEGQVGEAEPERCGQCGAYLDTPGAGCPFCAAYAQRTPTMCPGCGEYHRDDSTLCYTCLSRGPSTPQPTPAALGRALALARAALIADELYGQKAA